MFALFSTGLWAYALYTLGTTLWYIRYHRRLKAQMSGHLFFDQALAIKPVRRLRLVSFGVFLVALFSAARGLPTGPTLWSALGWIYLFYVIDSMVAYRVIKQIRQLEASSFENLKFTLRQLAAFGFLYTTYLAVLGGVAVSVTLVVQNVLPKNNWTQSLVQLGTPLGVFLGLVATFLLSPVFVRMMFPSSLVESEKLYGNLRGSEFSKSVLEAFRLAGFMAPKIRILELDRFRVHNAMITGFRKQRFGIGGPTVYFTKSLLRELKSDELEAVIKHEVSHLVLNHLKKRLFYSFVMVMASYIPVILVLSAIQWLIPALSKGMLSLLAIVVALAFQIFTLRRQVRRQEYEADAYAVKGLGADANALFRALLKLDRLNHQNSKRKDPWTYLNPASAHPTTMERGLALGQTAENSKAA